MIKKIKIIIVLYLILLVLSCASLKIKSVKSETSSENTIKGKMIIKNKIECYSEEFSTDNKKNAEEETRGEDNKKNVYAEAEGDSKKKNIYAEISGAEYVNGYAYFVNDKSKGGKPQVFKIKYENEKFQEKDIVYFQADKIIKSEKFEAIASTPDGKYMLAITAFDRVIPDTNKFDNYNKLINWRIDAEKQDGLSDENVFIAHQTDNSGILSSVSLRNNIKKCLADFEFPEGPAYFKIEGLTAAPGGKIFLGVREYGKKYNDFKYSIKILSADYAIENGELNIKDNWRFIYDFKTEGVEGFKNQLGVSGLAFDFKRNVLFVLTSFENKDFQFEGYLWHISLEDLYNRKPLKPVYDESGKSLLSFAPHKPEAITFLGDNKVLIAFDDDRVIKYKEIKGSESIEYGREPNEFWYEIIELDK